MVFKLQVLAMSGEWITVLESKDSAQVPEQYTTYTVGYPNDTFRIIDGQYHRYIPDPTNAWKLTVQR